MKKVVKTMKTCVLEQKDVRRETDSPNWGGRREGSGRKKGKKHPFSIRVTDAEERAIRALIDKLRKREGKSDK